MNDFLFDENLDSRREEPSQNRTHSGIFSSSSPPPSPSGSSHTRSHAPSSSSDFGAFASASPIASRPHLSQRASFDQQASLLDEDDLLGSFEPLAPQRTTIKPRHQESGTHPSHGFDLLGGETWHDATAQAPGDPSSFPHTSPRRSTYVSLPPRPTDISPDYVPPLRSPRRMSTTLFSPGGLGSPPIVSDAGNEIIFHPSQSHRGDGAMSEMRRVQLVGSNSTTADLAFPNEDTSSPRRSSSHSPPRHSSLLDTLATTTKLASKWRSALTSNTFIPPPERSSRVHQSPVQAQNKPLGPIPIDVTHVTPFATPEQIAGSYTAPTGAPGFNASHRNPPSREEKDEEWGQVTLSGRRESTTPVLTLADTIDLRRHLPPRQRLSASWTLLFSLDQHGASLSTLYRLVDRYAQSHRTSGNILLVRDGHGNRFGVYMNESIMKREGTYYGSGESFLFKLAPDGSVKPFRWTGRNQYFALCESGFVSFGGGAGTYGLLLDSTFTHNSSATCPAYDNEVLCRSFASTSTRGDQFDCVGLEVWAT